jgi:hypothetical protein
MDMRIEKDMVVGCFMMHILIIDKFIYFHSIILSLAWSSTFKIFCVMFDFISHLSLTRTFTIDYFVILSGDPEVVYENNEI